MRYDDKWHIGHFKETGKYPQIHNNLFNFILNVMPLHARMLDIGCSTGLLAQRLHHTGYDCHGIDSDREAILASPYPAVTILTIEPPFDKFFAYVDLHKIDTLVARRIFPELFGHNLDAGKTFTRYCWVHGITKIFLEGRQAHKNPINPLASVDDEIQLLSSHYEVKNHYGNIAYLTAKEFMLA